MRTYLRFAFVSPVLLALGCSHEIESPSPALGSVGPDLVCNAASVSRPNGTTNVALAGTNFTPMPSRTLDDPRRLLLPRVTLSPVAALPGGALPAAAFDIADDPANPSGSRVRWTRGRALGELLLQYGTLNHVATGDANTGAVSASVGYRFAF